MTLYPYFIGQNSWILGLEPLPGASNNLIGKISLKHFVSICDISWKILMFFQKCMKYNEKILWEDSPRSIPELLVSGTQIQAVLFVLKKDRIQNLKNGEKIWDRQTNMVNKFKSIFKKKNVLVYSFSHLNQDFLVPWSKK
jgi:hypothetical protein